VSFSVDGSAPHAGVPSASPPSSRRTPRLDGLLMRAIQSLASGFIRAPVRSRGAALQVGRCALPHHGLAEPLRAHVAQDLELLGADGRQLDAELRVALGVVDPAAVPGTARHRLDVADDLDAANLLG